MSADTMGTGRQIGFGRGWTRIGAFSLSVLALVASAVLTGCGQSMATAPLPDLAAKSKLHDGRQTLSSADQKKAIDALIAKRDGKDAPAPSK